MHLIILVAGMNRGVLKGPYQNWQQDNSRHDHITNPRKVKWPQDRLKAGHHIIAVWLHSQRLLAHQMADTRTLVSEGEGVGSVAAGELDGAGAEAGWVAFAGAEIGAEGWSHHDQLDLGVGGEEGLPVALRVLSTKTNLDFNLIADPKVVHAIS